MSVHTQFVKGTDNPVSVLIYIDDVVLTDLRPKNGARFGRFLTDSEGWDIDKVMEWFDYKRTRGGITQEMLDEIRAQLTIKKIQYRLLGDAVLDIPNGGLT